MEQRVKNLSENLKFDLDYLIYLLIFQNLLIF